jgi:hypothetical protein
MQQQLMSILCAAALAAAILPAQAAPAAKKAGTPPPANQFSAEADAKAHCQAGLVVWVNLSSHVYHFADSKVYGKTKHGAYMCEADATAAGDHAAKGEKHP